MEDYLKFLTSFLSDLGLTVDANDYIRFSDDAHSPILVEGRRLVLPTDAHRRNPSDDNLIFHPLSENTVADLSIVTKELLRIGSINLNIFFATHAIELIRLAVDEGRQRGLTCDQLDLIVKLKNVKTSDEKSGLAFIKSAENFIMDYHSKNQASSFIQLGLTRGRIYRGEKRHRAGEVIFPLYNGLLVDETKSRKDSKFDLQKDLLRTLIDVHEALFPAVSEAEAYGYAEITNRNIAPFFTTFALTYAQLGAEFKARQKTLQGLIHFSVEDEAPKLDWVGDLHNMDLLRKWANTIPDQVPYRAPAMRDGESSYRVKNAQDEVTDVVKPNEPVGVPYVGQKYMNSQGQLTELPPPSQATNVQKTPGRISPDDYLKNFSTGSPFVATQKIQSDLKAYIDGYGKFWDAHVQQFRVAPQGLPHPTTLPKTMLPPAYPGHTPLPMGFFPGGPIVMQNMPQGMPYGMQQGMMSQGMPYGMMPYGMPYGMQQGMMPQGMMPQGIPYGMQPGMMPQGMMPQGMPYGMQQGMMPQMQQGNGYGYGNQVNIGNHPALSGSNVSVGTVSAGTV